MACKSQEALRTSPRPYTFALAQAFKGSSPFGSVSCALLHRDFNTTGCSASRAFSLMFMPYSS
eukprot:6467876-Amphidinium_carterae.1